MTSKNQGNCPGAQSIVLGTQMHAWLYKCPADVSVGKNFRWRIFWIIPLQYMRISVRCHFYLHLLLFLEENFIKPGKYLPSDEVIIYYPSFNKISFFFLDWKVDVNHKKSQQRKEGKKSHSIWESIQRGFPGDKYL